MPKRGPYQRYGRRWAHGINLQEARIVLNLTQNDLSVVLEELSEELYQDKIKFNERKIRYYESGERSIPPKEVELFCTFYDKTMEELELLEEKPLRGQQNLNSLPTRSKAEASGEQLFQDDPSSSTSEEPSGVTTRDNAQKMLIPEQIIDPLISSASTADALHEKSDRGASSLDSSTLNEQPSIRDSASQQEQRDYQQRKETYVASLFQIQPNPPPVQAFTSHSLDKIADPPQVFSPTPSADRSLSSPLQESQIEVQSDLPDTSQSSIQDDDALISSEATISVASSSSHSPPQASTQRPVSQWGVQRLRPPRSTRRRLIVTGIVGTLMLCAGAGGAVWYSTSHQPRATHSNQTTPPVLTQSDLTTHTAPITSVIWSKAIVASGSIDGTVKAWDVSKVPQQVDATFGKPDSSRVVSSLTLSPDEKRLATGLWSSEVNIWDLAVRNVALTYTEHTSSVNTVAWSPTGDDIASGSSYPEGLVKVWDATTKELHYTVPPFRTKSGKIHNVSAVVWSADGTMIAVATLAGSVSFHDVRKKRPVFSLLNFPDSVNALAWEPKSLEETPYLVVGCGDYDIGSLTGNPTDTRVYVVNVKTGKEKYYLFHEQAVLAVAWSSDGRYVASASADQKVVVWEPLTGKIIATYEHSGPVLSVAWSPNNTAILSGGADKKIHIWQIPKASSS